VTTTTTYTDQQTIALLKEGSNTAFAEIYETYAPVLISFAAARLSLEEARDIIHDLFVHLWQERQHLHIQVSLKAFLFAAVRYRVIDRIRRQSTLKKYADQIASLPTTELTTEEEVYARELEKKLHAAISEMSPRIREVFKLSRFSSLSITEIAEHFQVSEQTVKNQLTTALAHLRARLGKTAFVLWWL
jgi:RNA polymerase sigma-70 factor (family 1)